MVWGCVLQYDPQLSQVPETPAFHFRSLLRRVWPHSPHPHTRCKGENNLWYPGQSSLDVRRVSSPVFDASLKELFRKDERGLILKTAAANRACNRQKGQLRVIFSLNGRKLLSSLQARWVLLWGKNPSPALDKSVLTVSRYILEILEPVYSAPILAAFGLSISPAHGDL